MTLEMLINALNAFVETVEATGGAERAREEVEKKLATALLEAEHNGHWPQLRAIAWALFALLPIASQQGVIGRMLKSEE